MTLHGRDAGMVRCPRRRRSRRRSRRRGSRRRGWSRGRGSRGCRSRRRLTGDHEHVSHEGTPFQEVTRAQVTRTRDLVTFFTGGPRDDIVITVTVGVPPLPPALRSLLLATDSQAPRGGPPTFIVDTGQIAVYSGQITAEISKIAVDTGQIAMDTGQIADDAGQIAVEAGRIAPGGGRRRGSRGAACTPPPRSAAAARPAPAIAEAALRTPRGPRPPSAPGFATPPTPAPCRRRRAPAADSAAVASALLLRAGRCFCEPRPFMFPRGCRPRPPSADSFAIPGPSPNSADSDLTQTDSD